MRAQQATTRDRRPSTIAVPPNRGFIAYTIEKISDTELRLTWDQIQSTLVTNGPVDYLIDNSPGNLVITVISESVLELESPTPIPDQFAFTVPPYSQSVRSPTGGFVEPGTRLVGTPLVLPIIATRLGSYQIACTPGSPVTWLLAQYLSSAGWGGSAPTTSPSGYIVQSALQSGIQTWELTWAEDLTNETAVNLNFAGTFVSDIGQRSAIVEIPIVDP